MHLVFLNQYYPPDAAPTGVMLADLVNGLLRDGHEVTVLSAAGGYAAGGDGVIRDPLAVNGGGGGKAEHPQSTVLSPTQRAANVPAPSPHPQVEAGAAAAVSPCDCAQTAQAIDPGKPPPPPALRIIRIGATTFGRGTFLGKLLDYASFYLGVSWKLLTLRPAPQRIVALTTPPYLSVLARLASKLRGADHAHWVMDLYPDVLAAHGMLDARRMPYRLLARLARWGFGGSRCAALLTLGPDMAERLARMVISDPLSVPRDGGGEPMRGPQAAQTTRDPADPAGGQESRLSWPTGVQPVVAAADRRDALSSLTGGTPVLRWVPLWGAVAGRDRCDVATGARRHGDGKRSGLADCTLQIEVNERYPAANSPSAISNPRSTIDDPPSSIAARALRQSRGWDDTDLVVMYSGNMGLGHRFGEILAAAKELGGKSGVAGSAAAIKNGQLRSASAPLTLIPDPLSSIHPHLSTIPDAPSPAPRRLRLVFFGGGKRRDEVADFARDHAQAGVELFDYAPADQLLAHLQSADVHLASLDPAWTGTMVPSKLQGIFAASRPVIFVGSAESSIGRWVMESGGGWVVAANDVAGLLSALEAASDPSVRATRGQAAKAFADDHFDPHRNVARVVKILTQ